MAETYGIEKLTNEPIILATMSPKYSVGRDMTNSDNEIRIMLDAGQEDMFVIADIRQVSLSFNNVMIGSSKGARTQAALWHHPKIKKMIFISNSNIVKLAARGLNSPFYGNLNVKVFETPEQALVYCRAQDAIKA